MKAGLSKWGTSLGWKRRTDPGSGMFFKQWVFTESEPSSHWKVSKKETSPSNTFESAGLVLDISIWKCANWFPFLLFHWIYSVFKQDHNELQAVVPNKLFSLRSKTYEYKGTVKIFCKLKLTSALNHVVVEVKWATFIQGYDAVLFWNNVALVFLVPLFTLVSTVRQRLVLHSTHQNECPL